MLTVLCRWLAQPQPGDESRRASNAVSAFALPLFAGAIALAGCEGVIEDVAPGRDPDDARDEPGSPDSPGTPGDAVVPPPGGRCDPVPSRTALRRLTREELRATVASWGLDVDLRDTLPEDGSLRTESPHPSNHDSSVSDQHLRGYERAAERIAAAIQREDRLGCPGGERACVEDALPAFLRRIFRRPARDEERAALLGVYDAGAQRSPDEGLRTLLTAALQTPFFLYHVEIGDLESADGAWVPLTPFEIASRLAFSIAGRAPGDALLDAAASGELASVEGRSRWARSLLASHPEVHTQRLLRWAHVHEAADLRKSEAYFEGVDESLGRALAEDIEGFLREQVVVGNAPFAEWWTAPLELASLERFGTPTARLGVLMHPAWLAVHAGPTGTIPTKRGKFIAENLLCLPIHHPPPNVEIPEIPENDGTMTTRQRFAQHGELACARACHETMDPFGYAFENFDALGQWQTEENGLPIDASGFVHAEDASEGYEEHFAFEDAHELTRGLAESPRMLGCFARRLFEATMGRPLDARDACSVGQIRDAFVAADGRYDAFVAALVNSDAFLHRERCQ